MPIPLGILAAAGIRPAGAAGAYELIETYTVGSTPQASITFSNLNTYTQYKHLQIRYVARSSRAVSFPDTVSMQVNGDSTVANYRWHLVGGDSANVASYNGQLNPAGLFVGAATGGSGTANAFAANVVDILDFGSTTRNKTVRTLGGSYGGSGFDNEVRLYSSLWMSQNAISSLVLRINSGNNFVQGSRFSIYGLKAS